MPRLKTATAEALCLKLPKPTCLTIPSLQFVFISRMHTASDLRNSAKLWLYAFRQCDALYVTQTIYIHFCNDWQLSRKKMWPEFAGSE
jgi:hypothetical protein